jgi:acetamidase/formamidase
MTSTSTLLLALTAASLAAIPARAQRAPVGADAPVRADYEVASRPETVTWGDFPADRAPVLRVPSGATVRINTISQQGTTQERDPVEFLGSFGVRREEILPDVLDFWAAKSRFPRQGRGPHILTGPIYVEGAEPGDVLEVQILDVATRVPYGFNNVGPTSGPFGARYPGSREGDAPLDIPQGTRFLIRTDVVDGREVALFSDRIHVPTRPFMGTMAVAPPDPVVGQPGVSVAGVQSSTTPGDFGGNLDVRDLGTGATLYLPVYHPGALFYVGDPHSVQGDGEVSGTAIEQSDVGVFRFLVHKGRTIPGPRAETATHWIVMGIDLDLDRAMKKATGAAVDFLVKEKGLTPAQALSLTSIAVDFRVAEVVDQTQVVTGWIRKDLFLPDR